jgi:hypothetical protein
MFRIPIWSRARMSSIELTVFNVARDLCWLIKIHEKLLFLIQMSLDSSFYVCRFKVTRMLFGEWYNFMCICEDKIIGISIWNRIRLYLSFFLNNIQSSTGIIQLIIRLKITEICDLKLLLFQIELGKHRTIIRKIKIYRRLFKMKGFTVWGPVWIFIRFISVWFWWI